MCSRVMKNYFLNNIYLTKLHLDTKLLLLLLFIRVCLPRWGCGEEVQAGPVGVVGGMRIVVY